VDEFRVVLLAHGSRDPRWRRPFEELAAGLEPEIPGLRLAFLESSPPTLDEVAGEAVRSGASGIRILPLFLAGGSHLDAQIEERVAAIRKRHPDLAVDILAAAGEDPRARSLFREMAKEAARSPLARGPEGRA
jgi:sirohydrochlorin cobaltochelatase